MRNYDAVGVQVPDILLPVKDIDPARWAVIACDQFTSQPEYWERVRQIVGDSPSTFHLVLPEVYLGTPDEKQHTVGARAAMRDYFSSGLLSTHEGMILVERTVGGKTRKGLMLALDLEKYDFNKGSQTLIRATEGTILDRIPPRMRIREGAELEVPHILVLIDDPHCTVIEPVAARKDSLPKLYDFELMQGSGHLTGYSAAAPEVEQGVINALEKLADPAAFQSRYNAGSDQGVLLFAMGDGNHSLATAKAIWEKIKGEVGMDHPARYALVEIENVHDDGLLFEPIHRVLFGVKRDAVQAMREFYGDGSGERVRLNPCADRQSMIDAVDSPAAGSHKIGYITPQGYGVIEVSKPKATLAVGTLQSFLDSFIKDGGAEKIDYVHGEDVVCDLGAQPGNCGFYLPGMDKDDLFKTVIFDGALPRKTFSMGEAHEKRFYMEARCITC